MPTFFPSSRSFILPGRLLLAGLSGAVLVWAVTAPALRGADGFPSGRVILPLAVGLSLLVIAATAAGRWQAVGGWFALAVAGQAAALQLIDAGPSLRYQHYSAQFLTAAPAAGSILLLQTGLVAAGLYRHRRALLAWLTRALRPWQIAGLGLLTAATAAALSPPVSRYAVETGFAVLVQVINLGNVVLLGRAWPRQSLPVLERLTRRVLESGSPGPARLDRLTLLAAGWVTTVSALFSALVYQRIPHIPDEVLYYFQARYLAAGRLTVPAPPVPEAFSFYLLPDRAAQWYSIFPPGWPAVLAAGMWAGLPWLVNPLLAGVNILLASLLLQTLYSRRTARMAVLLLAGSPWFVLMGMNFMAHTLTLTGFLAAALGLAWARQTGQTRWAWAAGLFAGLVGLIRPLDGVVVAGLLGLWAVGVGTRRLKWSALAGFAVAGMAVGGVMMVYNRAITGHALQMPLATYYRDYFGPGANALGFGPDRGLGWGLDAFPGHSPLEAVINGLLNLFSINVELHGWATGSLGLAGLALLTGAVRRRDGWWLALAAAVPAVYSLYWFNGGPDFGARYWYLTILPLTLLTVRGLDALAARLGNEQARLLPTIALLVVMAAGIYLPWRGLDKYYHFRGMQAGIEALDREYGFGRSLVLVRGDARSDYQAAWIYNPLDPHAGGPIYAWDRGAAVRAALAAAYPDRPVWVIDGPSLTGKGFAVRAGPLPPSTALAKP